MPRIQVNVKNHVHLKKYGITPLITRGGFKGLCEGNVRIGQKVSLVSDPCRMESRVW